VFSVLLHSWGWFLSLLCRRLLGGGFLGSRYVLGLRVLTRRPVNRRWWRSVLLDWRRWW